MAERLHREAVAAEVAVVEQRCVACHAAPANGAERLTPGPAVPLRDLDGRHSGEALASFLGDHYGGDAQSSADLAAFLHEREDRQPLQTATVGAGAILRGGRMWGEFGCAACHSPAGIDGLAQRTDYPHVVAFLKDASQWRPGLVHDFELSNLEASSLAAWLLRDQAPEPDSVPLEPGLLFECYEINIDKAEVPDLEGLEPSAQGRVQVVNVEPRTCDNHFCLRFSGYLIAPQTGEYTFTLGSDDASWLWINDREVIDNGFIQPHKRRSGKVKLDAGAHAVTIIMIEKSGGESLEFLWEGPGFDQQVVPSEAMAAATIKLTPPATSYAATDAAAVARGRSQYEARHCAACHSGDDLPTAVPASAWAELGEGSCAVAGDVTGLVEASHRALTSDKTEAIGLAAAMQRDGCLMCHKRDGEGGMGREARLGLVELADLGDEGRVPPDLTGVGNRLRRDWIESVLTGDERVRSYMRARMPNFSPEQATRYADWFAAADAVEGDAKEPEFTVALANRGRELAGSDGHNCITCHTFAGRESVGVDGMDLAVQHERLRPGWFRRWLLHAIDERPGTRMPVFWPEDNEAANEDVDALWNWISLGSAAPVPKGFPESSASLELDPRNGPRLHGAFLEGLSARCLMVGTPERTHYAYDMEHAHLAWLWRGAFADATGTWAGRAGKLLRPAGEDWEVLEPLAMRSEDPPSVGETSSRAVIGRLVGSHGFPVYRLQIGSAVVDDCPLPRLAAGGSELVRTLTCVEGVVHVEPRTRNGDVELFVDGKPAEARTLKAGEKMEIVYQW
ncbi:MAG: PA14 domain-containing protein [Planctomycetota bacterium]|nr:PA14 domain-containing protein [Planctomycetota bacterium]